MRKGRGRKGGREGGREGWQGPPFHLQITVEDVGGMQILEPPQDLIKEILVVLVGKRLIGADDPV